MTSEPEPGSTAANGKLVESVWDYPRPPRLETVDWQIEVIHRGQTIVDAPTAFRVLETSQPPAYYVASEYVRHEHLAPSSRVTGCEWKGLASYVDVVVADERVADAGWFYAEPSEPFRPLTDHYAFYADRLDRCLVDGERVEPNDGSFYGGWITTNVTGPFKGAPGTLHW